MEDYPRQIGPQRSRDVPKRQVRLKPLYEERSAFNEYENSIKWTKQYEVVCETGFHYRMEPNGPRKCNTFEHFVTYGDVVYAISIVEDNWVEVREHFWLPLRFGGMSILREIDADPPSYEHPLQHEVQVHEKSEPSENESSTSRSRKKRKIEKDESVKPGSLYNSMNLPLPLNIPSYQVPVDAYETSAKKSLTKAQSLEAMRRSSIPTHQTQFVGLTSLMTDKDPDANVNPLSSRYASQDINIKRDDTQFNHNANAPHGSHGSSTNNHSNEAHTSSLPRDSTGAYSSSPPRDPTAPGDSSSSRSSSSSRYVVVGDTSEASSSNVHLWGSVPEDIGPPPPADVNDNQDSAFELGQLVDG